MFRSATGAVVVRVLFGAGVPVPAVDGETVGGRIVDVVESGGWAPTAALSRPRGAAIGGRIAVESGALPSGEHGRSWMRACLAARSRRR
jgi:hypothetical protein